MNKELTNDSEEQLYKEAIAEPLDSKVKKKAIGLLQIMCAGKRERSLLCFSGGKDSIVIKHLANMAGIKKDVVYSVTTIDPPELIYYIRDNHKDVIWNKPEMHMLEYMVEKGKGLPTRLCRWCCEKYKENTGNDYDVKIIGVRAEESIRRKGLWKQVNPDAFRKNSCIIAPIVYWTDKDIWDFIHGENIPYCSLYDEGFTRLGCIGCPLAGPKKQKIEFERWPRYKNLWWIYTKKFWDKWHGVPTKFGTPRWFESFKSADNYFNWWLSGVSVDKYNELVQKQAIAEYSEIPKDADCQSRFMTM